MRSLVYIIEFKKCWIWRNAPFPEIKPSVVVQKIRGEASSLLALLYYSGEEEIAAPPRMTFPGYWEISAEP